MVAAVTTPAPVHPATRTLVLVRHSKASHHALTDLERPLTSRGWDMADDLARDLHLAVGDADLLLVSPAARARQSALPVEQRLSPAEMRVEPAIYHEGPSGILDLVTVLDDEVRTVVVVGHEPTVSVLAHMLHDADDALASQVSFGVPTATALILDVPTSWTELCPRSAHLGRVLTAAR